ncbi:MAG: cysteine desulfurase family protein [Patescibacteria group bacterium]
MTNKNKRIYWDTAAATFCRPEILEIMLQYSSSAWANPSALHQEGRIAKELLEKARNKIAGLLEVKNKDIIFTSGGTEANNLAVLGMATAWPKDKGKIITTEIEHKSVLEPISRLAEAGWQVVYLPVDKSGRIKIEQLETELKTETALVSIALANNEIGTIQDMAAISRVVVASRRPSSYYPVLHTDACQGARFLDIRPERLGVDMVSLNGSKIYGPHGTGLLTIKEGLPLKSVISGGQQEFGLRAGTEDPVRAFGLALALEAVWSKRVESATFLSSLRDQLWHKLKTQISDCYLNSDLKNRLPNNLNISFKEVKSEDLVVGLDALGLAVSAGSACLAGGGRLEDSYVVTAVAGAERAGSAIRISLGEDTSKEDIDCGAEKIKHQVDLIRKASTWF